jgi:dihydropyrimidinase
MAEYDLLIINGIVVTDTDVSENAVAIRDGRIAELIPTGEARRVKAERTIDARGAYVTVCMAHEACCLR